MTRATAAAGSGSESDRLRPTLTPRYDASLGWRMPLCLRPTDARRHREAQASQLALVFCLSFSHSGCLHWRDFNYRRPASQRPAAAETSVVGLPCRVPCVSLRRAGACCGRRESTNSDRGCQHEIENSSKKVFVESGLLENEVFGKSTLLR